MEEKKNSSEEDAYPCKETVYQLYSQIEKHIALINEACMSLEPKSESSIFKSQEEAQTLLLAPLRSISELLKTVSLVLAKGNDSPTISNNFSNQNMKLFSKTFRDLMDLSIELFVRSLFPIGNLSPFIITLANVHLLYIKMIAYPDVRLEKEVFLRTWDAFMQSMDTIRSLIYDIDFACYINKLKELFNFLSKLSDENSNNLLVNMHSSLEVLTVQLDMLNAKDCPSETLTKNSKKCLERFREEFLTFKDHIIKTKGFYINEINAKVKDITQLVVVLDSGLNAFKVLEVAKNVDSIIKSDNFVLDPKSLVQPGLLYKAFLQGSELMKFEMMILNGDNTALSKHINSLSKRFIETMEQQVFDAEIVANYAKALREWTPIEYSQKDLEMVDIIEKNIEPYLKSQTPQAKRMLEVKKLLDTFKMYIRDKYNTSENSCLGYRTFTHLCDLYMSSKDPHDKDIEPSIQEYKYILIYRAINTHCNEFGRILSDKIFDMILYSPNMVTLKDTSCEKEDITSIISLLSKVITNSESFPCNIRFLQTLKQFLMCCKGITTYCEKFNLYDTLYIMYSYTPDPTLLIKALYLDVVNSLVSENVNNLLASIITNEGNTADITKKKVEISEVNIFNEETLKKISKFSILSKEVTCRAKLILLFSLYYNRCFQHVNSKKKTRNGMYGMIKYNSLAFHVDPQLLGIIFNWLSPLLKLINTPHVSIVLTNHFLSDLLDIFKTLFENNFADSQLLTHKIFDEIPFIDVSGTLMKCFINLTNTEIEIKSMQYKDNSEKVRDFYNKFKETEAEVISAITTGNANISQHLTSLTIKKAEEISPTFTVYNFLPSFTYIIDNLKAVSDIIISAVKFFNSTLKIEVPFTELVIQNFMFNFFLSFCKTCSVLADKGLISGKITTLSMFINKIIFDKKKVLYPITPAEIKELIYCYEAVKKELQIDTFKLFDIRISPIIFHILTLIDNSDIHLTKETSESIRKIQKLIHDIKAEKDEWYKKAITMNMKNVAWELRQQCLNADSRITTAFDQLFLTCDTIFMINHAQHLSYICDRFITRYVLSENFPLEHIISPFNISDNPFDYDLYNAKPVPEYLENYQYIKSLLDTIYQEITPEDTELNAAIKSVIHDVNNALNEALDNCKLNIPEIGVQIAYAKLIIEETNKVSQSLMNNVAQYQNLVDKLNHKIKEEVEELVSAEVKYDIVQKDKSIILEDFYVTELKLANIRESNAELTRLVEKYERTSTGTKGDIMKKDKKDPTANKGYKYDPAIIIATQELTDYLDENRMLKKELEEVSHEARPDKPNNVINDIQKLERKKHELDEELNRLSKEVLESEEEKACENDEELFDLFDKVREPLLETGKFNSNVNDNARKLIEKLIKSIEYHEETVNASCKIESMKKQNC